METFQKTAAKKALAMTNNLFERMFDKALNKALDGALETASRFKEVQSGLFELTAHVNQLARAIVNLAQTVQMHQQALTDVYAMQAQILQKIKGDMLDVKLHPEKKEKSSKPN